MNIRTNGHLTDFLQFVREQMAFLDISYQMRLFLPLYLQFDREQMWIL